jgi:hypothetical protein
MNSKIFRLLLVICCCIVLSASNCFAAACGSANGKQYPTACTPSAFYACSSGTPSNATWTYDNAPGTQQTGHWSWTCTDGTIANCSTTANTPAMACSCNWGALENGQCGSANGSGSAPGSTCSMCSSGGISRSIASNYGSYVQYVWDCAGLNGGTSSNNCSSTVYPVNGACGSANGQSYYTQPTTNLCSVGSNGAVIYSGSNSWLWVCYGQNGGSDAGCFAYEKVDGSCGTANEKTYYNTDTGYGSDTQCATGTASNTSFPAAGNSITWVCNGLNGGNNSSTCSASRISNTCGSDNGQSYSSLDSSSSGLCSLGASSSSFSGSGPWTWTCTGAWTYKEPNGAGAALSSNGQYQVVAANSLHYTSSDYGDTWSSRSSPSAVSTTIGLSSTGQYQTTNGEYIFTSSDYGANWTSRDSSRNWSGRINGVAISSTGQYQTMLAEESPPASTIYTSSNYGVTWTPRGGNHCMGVAMSSNAQYQTAACYNAGTGDGYGRIYVSTDYGATWNEKTSMKVSGRFYYAIAMSSSGQYQTIATANSTGTLYTSSDYGATWVSRDSSRSWSSMNMDSTGQYQFATITTVSGGALYESSNYGATWTLKDGGPSKNYGRLAISSTGKYQVLTKAEFSGTMGIYTSNNFGDTATSSCQANFAGNQPPIVNAGTYTANAGQTINLNSATASDPESGPLTYLWSCYSGTLSDSSVLNPNYTAPAMGGTDYCSLTAYDNQNDSSVSIATITVVAPGQCGSVADINKSYSKLTDLSPNLCATGSSILTGSFISNLTTWTWTCRSDSGGGDSSTCTAKKANPRWQEL